MIPQRVRVIVLCVAVAVVLASLVPRVAASRLPGDNQGYEPQQPLDYSHRLHAGELQIPCLYCHSGAEQGRHAGIPSASVCMNCHEFVTTTFGELRAEDELAKKEGRKPRRIVSEEIQKIYDALGLDEKLQRDPTRPTKPIEWIQVHKLPDHAFFDHRAHVVAGVECQSCHGPVETMERMRQENHLSMGWCLKCHREVSEKGLGGRPANASSDCSACHR